MSKKKKGFRKPTQCNAYVWSTTRCILEGEHDSLHESYGNSRRILWTRDGAIVLVLASRVAA